MRFQIDYLDETESTNTVALEYARSKAREGKVIVAEYQTAGRGKPGNRWISPKGQNLLFSLLIRPRISAAEAPILTQIACRSVAQVLRHSYHIPCQFKRPNDLMIEDRKICGILVESLSRASGKIEAVVIGIGLNVNASPDEMPPGSTSMRYEKGKNYDRALLLKRILHQLKEDLTCYYDNCSRHR